MRKLIIIAVILSFLFSIALFASTTGRIAGRVTDSSGRPIAYANVILQGTQIGAQTKENGSFIIINIPPGVYNVVISAIGYDKYTVAGVRVSADGTATVNAKLSIKGVAIEGVTVNAKEEKIEKAKVGSGHDIRMDQSADVAVKDVEGLIALEAGVTTSGGEIHVRGGRANEVVYSIDGMSVSDPVDGGAALSVDTDAIQDMKIMTGSFSAEYGNAQSGVVNIVTKDGDAFYSGKLELNTDHLLGGLSDNDRSDLKGRNSDLVKFALGGPILGDVAPSLRPNLTFYLNGAAAWDDGRYRALYKNSPNQDFLWSHESYSNPDSIVHDPLLENQYSSSDPYEDRDNFLGFDLGNRNFNSYNVNLKTKYIINALQNVTLGVRGDHVLNFPYSHTWKYALDHYAYDKTDQRQYIMTYDRSFSPIQMNLKVKASYYDKIHKLGPKGIGRSDYFHMYTSPDSIANDASYRNRYIDNILNNGDYGYNSIDADGDKVMDNGYLAAREWTYRVTGLEEAQLVSGFNAPGTIFDTFVDDETSTFNFRADLEYQLNSIHLAKTGFEFYKHHIVKDQLGGFLSTYEDRRQRYLNGIYNMHNYVDTNPSDSVASVPSQLVAVVQSDSTTYIPIYKPEDYLNAAYAASGTRDSYKADPIQGAYYIQDKMEWEGMIVNMGVRADFWYLGKKYEVYKVTKNGDGYYSVNFKPKDRMQLMISPRLGVSHPISERDVLRFAYNYQNQLPQMQFVFTSRDSTDVTDHPVVGNPSLQPQITVTYEVGLQHQISEDYVADITAYYKNIYNYVSTKKVRKADNEYYYQYISEDYGSTRGIDLTLEKYLSNFFSANLAYSLAWAQGNNSDVVIQDEQTSLREFPLDWDIRHNLNANFTFRVDRGEEYFIPFTTWILPLDDFSANLTYNISSGSPYTGMTSVGNTYLDTNSKRKDFTQTTNLKLTKTFALNKKTSLRLFMDVENLFKNKNILAVYPRTGSPYWDDPDLAEPNTGFVYPEKVFVHRLYILDPSMVDNERNITFGVSYNF
ncbi:MAG TPA: carboxypeptidase regulatory-like domain-containing protein [Candidatus Cloacimonadota bacterium]|nr:carboxypeptidase regulatory-like domain-containing protein [Candidatus Cloacimonadota bacterium]HPT70661.1 carboxypeptidase regulatory-like domain-containing protein [Candidatus Cloacimonadota bacterium]